MAAGAQPDLSSCKLLPVILTYDEALGMQAFQHRADRELKRSLEERAVPLDRIAPLLVLTIRDIEDFQYLQAAAPVEDLLLGYAEYLTKAPHDWIGSFHSYTQNRYPTADRSPLLEKAQELINEIVADLQKRADGGNYPEP